MSELIDDRTSVLALLQMSGLTPTPEEIDTMVAGYPLARQAAQSLYTVPGVRYETPAITFDPRLATS
jgi:hypothetical protein